MASRAVSARMGRLVESMSGLFEYMEDPVMLGRFQPGAADFVFGNPHEGTLPEFWQALQRWIEPRDKDWYAYKLSEPEATSVVAEYLSEFRGRPWPQERILMTNGTFTGLAATLQTLVDSGDEVIYVKPPWFFYDVLVRWVGATPVEVEPAGESFDLDIGAIAGAITERTRAIIVNTPNNPTGRIYPAGDLAKLADLLREASQRGGRPIYLLSDEAYNRIVFDGRQFVSPTDHYEHSVLLYTYGKTLLTPGQRLGYIALSPAMPDAEEVYRSLFLALMLCGWAFPNALLQHALGDIQQLSIDIDHLQKKRDRMIERLRAAGYETNEPEGTFFLLVKSPWTDDVAFARHLATRQVFIMPGRGFDMPGYLRLSLTASDEMIDKALPVFAEAAQRGRHQGSR